VNCLLKTLFIAVIVYPWGSAFAVADLLASFDEGAPKDRFTFTNTGTCAITNAKLTLDLSSSKSGLIFDVTGDGAGVDVFQPLVIMSGADALEHIPTVKDGDNQLTLDVKKLDAGQSIALTIDVDDTMGDRETIISGAEISGAKIHFSQANKSTSVIFNSNARTTVKRDSCASY